MTTRAFSIDAAKPAAGDSPLKLAKLACPDRALFLAPWAVLSAATLFSLLFPALAQASALPALALSALVLGMPHGAGDVAALRAAGKWSARSGLAYLSAVFATFLVWHWSAPVALLAFLGLTLWHWGEGDAWIAFSGSKARILAALGRGAILMAAPLAFQGDASLQILAPLWSVGGTTGQSPVFLTSLAPFVVAAGALASWLATRLEPTRGAVWTLETLLVLAFWACVPPLLGVAIYLCGVHAWRHLLRLETRGGRGDSRRSLLQIVAHWHREGALASLAALLLLPLAPYFWPPIAASAASWSAGWSASYLILIAALTTPHALTVAFLARQKQL